MLGLAPLLASAAACWEASARGATAACSYAVSHPCLAAPQVLGTYKPLVWEYSRLNITHNVMSKRKLNRLVTDK